MSLALAVIGVLAEDHDADLIERRQVERPKPFAAFWEDPLPALALDSEEALEISHVGLVEFAAERFEPARMQLDSWLVPHEGRA